MALAWSTFKAIPTLRNYTEAKDWHDHVNPIRGDAHGTRPVGRRDQKWFNIWDKRDAIHVGYGTDPESRQSLVSYHKDGTILVHKRNRWASASDNERLNRLLNSDVRTHQYDVWIGCAWYDGGVKRKGHLPLQCNGQRNWDAAPKTSVFTRDSEGSLVYLNYTYPVTHKPNKVRLKEAIEPLRSFITFAEGLRKLQGSDSLLLDVETRAEFFGWDAPWKDWNGVVHPRAKPAPTLLWGDEAAANREQFFKWATSDDHTDRMRAVVTMSNHDHLKPTLGFLKDMMFRTNPDELLEKTVQTSGTFVTDRYKRYFRG